MTYDVNYTCVPKDGSGPRKTLSSAVEAESFVKAVEYVEETLARGHVVVRLEIEVRW